MVHGGVTLFFVAPFEEWEFGDPQEVELAFVDEVALASELEAQVAEAVVDDLETVGTKEDDVADFGVGGFTDLFHHIIGEELGDRRFDAAVWLHDEICKAFGAIDGDVFAEGVEFTTAEIGHAFGVESFDGAAVFEGLVEDFEATAACDNVGKLDELEAEAGVWLVRAVAAHGFLPGHAWEWQRDIHAEDFFEGLSDHLLGEAHDFVFVDEAHFQVELGEFWLTICAQVFVTEAASDLEIFVDAADHEELFVLLWRLWQGVELSGVEATRHEEVAGAFWGRTHEDWGFDLPEAFFIEVVADALEDLMTQLQVLLHDWTAQIEVAIFEADVFIHVGVVDEGVWWGFCGVVDDELGADDVDLAGGELRIFHAFWAWAHGAANAEDVFAADVLCFFKNVCVAEFWVDGDLNDAAAVTQIDENDATVVAAFLDPTGDDDLFTDVFQRKLGAIMGSL